MRHGTCSDVDPLDLAQLEHQRVANVLLLDLLLAAEEHAGLAVMIGERLRADARLWPLNRRGKTLEPQRRVLARPALRAPAVGLVVGAPLGVGRRHVTVLLEVHHRAARRVDRDVGEVGSTESLQLGVEVGEVTPV